MTTPSEAAKGLGRAQKAAILHGIGGARRGALDSLEHRGIVTESERKPGYLELSPLGLCVRTLLRGYDPEGMGDEARVAYYLEYLKHPHEWDACDRHEGQGTVYQWVWTIPERDDIADDHITAIQTDSEPVMCASCPVCADEDEERYEDCA